MGWIGVDLDGSLAHYDEWRGGGYIGEPIPAMVERVKTWLSQGIEVRIVTARATVPSYIPPIQDWCQKHLGTVLKITATKDFEMKELWDDRAVQLIPNTGQRVDGGA